MDRHNHYQQVFKSTPIPSLLLEPDPMSKDCIRLVVFDANDAFEKHFGLSRMSLAGKTWVEVFGNQHLQQEEWEMTLKQMVSREDPLAEADGQLFFEDRDYRMQAFSCDHGRISVVFLTEEKAERSKLPDRKLQNLSSLSSTQEENFLVEVLSDGGFRLLQASDSNGMNTGFLRRSGITRMKRDLYGFFENVLSTEEAALHFKRCVETRTSYQFLLLSDTLEGSPALQITLTPFQHGDRITHLICTIQDHGFIKQGEMIRQLKEEQRYIQQGKFQKDLLLSMIQILEIYDPYTRGHSENVARDCAMVSEMMGLDHRTIRLLYWAGLVHDIGKFLVPKEILDKPYRLAKEEFDLIKMHSAWGARVLGTSGYLTEVADLVLHHHERIDGKGYPDGLSGSHIPLGSRVIAVADGFDAMVNDRPYRRKLAVPDAVKEMVSACGQQYDPDIVSVFLGMKASSANNPQISAKTP